MTKTFTDSRRDLRERAFQTLLSLEFTGQFPEAANFAYQYDKELEEGEVLDTPAFLLNLVKGVLDNQEALNQAISAHLKKGWSLERLTLTDKVLLQLGLYEIRYHQDTPDRVALNEIIEIAKKYSDPTSAKFINGILTKFIPKD